MKHAAKIAGTNRHSLNTLGAMIVGAGLANSDQVESAQVLLSAIGVGPDAQLAIGAVLVAVAYVASWRSKAKRIGEGDF